MKKTIIFILLAISFLLVQITNVSAEEETYQVVVINETGTELLTEFTNFLEAKEYFHAVKGNYSNLGVYLNDKLMLVKNGLVLIPNGDCSVNFEYRHVSNNFKGYTNGCYAIDALYLDTNDTGASYKFELAGVQAWGSAAELQLIPIEQTAQMTSYYVREGSLYHQIKTSMSNSGYGNTLNLGPAPDYLLTDQLYVSFNGHYFYKIEDFDLMVNDLRNNTYRSAVNSSNPYYNYYLMLPHRTQTNHTAEGIKIYFQEVMGYKNPITYYVDEDFNSINDFLTRSQYYEFESSFFVYEGLFGTNAMMMLALSMNETASGRSSLAFTRNNLFGHAAYDSDVENNAQRYLTISASIYSHAKNYISARYANPEKFQYHGSHFGDKASGMNVAYASDPYWSEKAVQYYIALDKYFGYLDYNTVAIGIKTSNQKVTVYDEDLATALYQTTSDQNFPFVILESSGAYYKVQVDPPLIALDSNVEYSYDFKKNVGYVSKSDINIILNPNQIKEPAYLSITYDAKDGNFKNELTKMTVQPKNQGDPLFEEPIKEGYLFSEWKMISESSTTIYYEAVYQKIEKIEITTVPPTTIELANRISLKGGTLAVKLEGQEEYEIPITTSMVSNYTINEAGNYDVQVQYGGASTSYKIEISADLDATRAYLNEQTVNLVKESDNGRSAEDLKGELNDLKELLTSEFYPRMNLNTIHVLDRLFLENNPELISTIIHQNEYNLSVSGLYLSIATSSPKLFKDTFEIKVIGEVEQSAEERLAEIAISNGYSVDQSFSLKLTNNGQQLQLNGPLVFTIDKPNQESNRIYLVLQIVDGEVTTLQTATYANSIKFKIFEEGSFLVVSRPTNNVYSGTDFSGTVTSAMNGFNYHQLASWLPFIIILILLFVAIVVLLIVRKRKRHK